jgi:hypothetical protein
MFMEKDSSMKKKTKVTKEIQQVPRSKGPIDPYTGQVEPPAEGAYKVEKVESTDPRNRQGENYLINEEDALDKLALDANADEVSRQMQSFTDDEDVKDDFEDRQKLASGGRQKLEEKFNEHHSLNPNLSGGDVDAAWDDSSAAGEESVGGSVPTPDQDNVDELGKAAGFNYQDEEPLNSDKKILDRDRQRWELDPRSAEDQGALATDEEEEEAEEKEE